MAEVRAKWRDYASITKCKAAALRREQERTGCGSTSLPPLNPGEAFYSGPRKTGGSPRWSKGVL